MHLIYRNVNRAFRGMVDMFHRGHPSIRSKPSRNGDVLMIEEPVVITYGQPRERVLLNQARDANPYFHMYESLWMLAGRNNLAPLEYYVSTFGQFSDDGKTLNGAYGHRWRYATKVVPAQEETQFNELVDTLEYRSVDQLSVLIDHLKANPTSRRAVLQMWNVEDDLLKVDSSRDVCCNLSVMFSLRETPYNAPVGVEDNGRTCLDMTVTNRSNDLIWGTLGANAVHFSFLQEYMACCLGVEVGVYNQFSNNQHVYTDPKRWEPDKWLAAEEQLYPQQLPVPLVKDKAVFDREVAEFVERNGKDGLGAEWTEPFLRDVAQPMCAAYHAYKRKEYNNALLAARDIQADDWRLAATQWLERRKK